MVEQTPVTLEEMLAARDGRAARQRLLLERYRAPLIYLTFNIPGPIKLPKGSVAALELACRRIDGALEEMNLLHHETVISKTGCEACYVVDADPAALKRITMALEDADDFGRLLDLDVLAPSGEKLARATPRTCLLCGNPAQVCGRSRAHRLEELSAQVNKILQEALS